MSKDGQVLARLNPFGHGRGIEEKDIDRILNPETEIDEIDARAVVHFFNLPIDKLTKELLTRYVIACNLMTNVSVASYHKDISPKLIHTIASAKRCFCYGEYLACIELCALNGEMLANFLCIVHKEFLSDATVIDKLPSNAKKSVEKHLPKDGFYDAMNQKHRISWLAGGGVLSKEDCNDLLKIHEIRTKYFHRWEQDHGDIDNDAISSLTLISGVASKHLEMFDNQGNVKKVRAYISKDNRNNFS